MSAMYACACAEHIIILVSNKLEINMSINEHIRCAVIAKPTSNSFVNMIYTHSNDFAKRFTIHNKYS